MLSVNLPKVDLHFAYGADITSIKRRRFSSPDQQDYLNCMTYDKAFEDLQDDGFKDVQSKKLLDLYDNMKASAREYVEDGEGNQVKKYSQYSLPLRFLSKILFTFEYEDKGPWINIFFVFQYYNMSKEKGRVLIIDVKFEDKERQLIGSDSNIKKLEAMFDQLGFEVAQKDVTTSREV